jgi:CHAD domain-containing protein
VRLDESAAPPSSAPLSEQVRARIGAQLDALVAHDPGARLGGDPEDVHDLRVAVRRLRALLRAARDVVDPVFAEPLRAELQWLGDSLGPARDLDVLLAYLRSDAARFDDDDRTAFDPLLATLEGTREQAQPALLETLRSERYLALLDELERAAASLPLIPGAAVSPQDLAGAEFRKLRKAVRALDGHPEPEAVHAVRIKGKRARYAAELASGKRAKRVVGAAKGFQDVVGEYQDAVVAEKRLRELVRGRSGRAALAIGRLVERQRRRREAALSALPRAWRKLERAGRRAWT